MGLPGKFKRLRVQNYSDDVYINDINTLVVPDGWLVITGPDEATLIAGTVFSAADYGIMGVAHGGTPVDESAALTALLAIVYAAGGGIIQFRNRKYRFDSQIVIPNDGAATPSQPSIKIVGQGASHNGQGGVPVGGTIIDLRFTGAPAKIDTRGLGLLEIASLTLMDGGAGSSTAFIQTTNTTLKIDQDVEFYGNTGITPTQDAIILGGTTTVLGGAIDAPFQGYGTIIANTFSNRIQRLVYARTYVNAVVIRDNTGWTQNGGPAFIEFVAGAAENVGNVIVNNLVEINNYVNVLKTTGTFTNNTVGPTNCYDASGTTTAIYKLQTGAEYNLIFDGYRDDAIPLVAESGSAVGANTLITSHQSQTTLFPNPVNFTDPVKNILNTGTPSFILEEAAGNQFYQLAETTSSLTFARLASGGSEEKIMTLERVSATRMDLYLRGSADNRIFAFSDLRVLAASGSTLWLGTVTNDSAILVSGSGTIIADLRATVLKAGSTPVTLTDAAGKILSAALNTVGADVGGTGLTSYAVGDLLYASAATVIGKLADVAVGSVMISGGVATAPAWSTKLGLGAAVDATAKLLIQPVAYTVGVDGIKILSSDNTQHAILQTLKIAGAGGAINFAQCSNMYFDTAGAVQRYDTGQAAACVNVRGSDGAIQFYNGPTGSAPGITLVMTSSGNLGIGTSTFGTSAAKVLALFNGTAPSTGPADTVQFYSSDDAAGHTIPSFFTEGTNVVATGQADSASSVRVKMRINGTVRTFLCI